MSNKRLNPSLAIRLILAAIVLVYTVNVMVNVSVPIVWTSVKLVWYNRQVYEYNTSLDSKEGVTPEYTEEIKEVFQKRNSLYSADGVIGTFASAHIDVKICALVGTFVIMRFLVRLTIAWIKKVFDHTPISWLDSGGAPNYVTD